MKKLRLTLLVKLTFLVVISLTDGLAGKVSLFLISTYSCYFTLKRLFLEPCKFVKMGSVNDSRRNLSFIKIFLKQVKSYLVHKSVYSKRMAGLEPLEAHEYFRLFLLTVFFRKAVVLYSMYTKANFSM